MSLAAQKKTYQEAILSGMARALWIEAYVQWVETNPTCRWCDNAISPDGTGAWQDETGDGYTCEESVEGHELNQIEPGSDLDEVVPETPDAAFLAAHDLGKLIMDAEGMASEKTGLADLFELAMTIHAGEPFEFVDPMTRIGSPVGKQLLAEDVAHGFGFDLASQSMGQGVSWADNHRTRRGRAHFDPKLPSFEVHYDGQQLDWSGRERQGKGARRGRQEARYIADDHNTQQSRLGRIVFVNPDNAKHADHDFVIGGPMGHVYLVYENNEGDAFDELADYLVEHAPGLLADEEYQQHFEEAKKHGKSDARADEIAQEGLFTAGNAGNFMKADEWRLLAKDPAPSELYEIAGVAQNPCGSRARKNPSPGDEWGDGGDQAYETQQIVRDAVKSNNVMTHYRPEVFSAISPEGKAIQAEAGAIGTERELGPGDVFLVVHPKAAARELDSYLLAMHGTKLEGDFVEVHVRNLLDQLVFMLNRTWPMPNAIWTTKIWGWGYIALTDNEGLRGGAPRNYVAPPAESAVFLIGLSHDARSNPAPRRKRRARGNR